MINEELLLFSEKIILSLRSLYYAAGYEPYRMSKFEEYDLYADHKRFLVSDNVITFTDTNGKLMALKPDVTLSIIKNSKDEPEKVRRLSYNENVYRVSKGTNSYKEIMQAGIECLGNVRETEVFEVLSLAAESLKLFSPEAILSVSDLSIMNALIGALGLRMEEEKQIMKAVSERNVHELEEIAKDAPESAVSLLKEVLSTEGSAEEVLGKLDVLFENTPVWEEYASFRRILEKIVKSAFSGTVRVDFSVINDVLYYNGLIFKGFVPGIPEDVLSGGQYDRLMARMNRVSGAIGFAVYTDKLLPVSDGESAGAADDPYLNVALPKGRLGEKVYRMFAAAGFECPSIMEENRKLIFEDEKTKVRYFWVKPSDVAIYVERGAADVGVAGKDILLEYEPDVYELLDLKTGICRMAVAGPKDFADDQNRALRVATKFQNVALRYYQAIGRDIDVIRLNGSIELAPILNLSDVIVDIVETGTTLRENNLTVIEEIAPISARLISNKAAYKFKYERITALKEGLGAVLSEA